jgi:hypothetical protein
MSQPTTTPQHEIQEGEIESVNENEHSDDDMQGFDFEGGFDPMQAIGQLLVTPEGETIPDVLTGIRHALETLTKVLHKISKSLDKK